MMTLSLNARNLAFAVLGSVLYSQVRAQVQIEVGTGTILNTTFQAPSPYANQNNGSRNQLLIPAGELQAAGMTTGTILGLGFDVLQESGITFTSFSVSMGTTAAAELTGTWETGLSLAWGPYDFTDVAGWTYHAFDAPYFWDGVSNLVVETCYSNSTSSQNALVYQTGTSYVSCVARNSFNPAICTDLGGTHVQFQQRPNVRFQWLPLETAPVASIGASPMFSCTGTISFTDESLYTPTSWAWNFGDDSTSVEQDPVHTFANSGTYVVTLIVSNAFGVDTAEVTVTVDLSGTQPVAACDALSTGTVEDFGILDVNIEGVAHPSGDAVTDGGYVDNTCGSITVVQGTDLDLAIATANAAPHAVRAWLDLDNSGTFTANELVLTGTGPNLSSSTLIGAGVVLNTPLRLRSIAAYDLVTPDPPACGSVQYGQAEDFSIIVVPNPLPPVTSFSAAPVFTCDGTVQFTDLSLNTPTAWAWDFGDTGTSDVQSPSHTYTASGSYTVSLIAINANGQDDTVAVNVITVDLGAQLVPAVCTPNTQAYCCGYGLLDFQFANMNTAASSDGSEGYQDRSCGNVAQLEEGLTYTWSATTNAETPHDTRVWVDLNNDGDFTANELLVTALGQSSPNGNFTMPAATVFGTAVRVRVQCDVIGQSVAACDAPLYGQVEDFSAVIQPNTDPPTAAFSANPTTTCDGFVQFTDLSANVPDSWQWTFGDGGVSTEQNPTHTYDDLGTFTVSLTVTNENGSNTVTQTNVIHYVPGWQCDTLQLDGFADLGSFECLGVLADDGGPEGNYTGGTSGAYNISPVGAEFVTLTFSQFAWGNNPNRVLAIYDGPDTFSPLIGQFTGNGLGQLPNIGILTSTGPSITLRQEQQGGGGQPPNSAGFLLTWNCSYTGVEETATDPILNIHPIPADDWFVVDLEPSISSRRYLVVRNALGQILATETIAGNATRVRVDSSKLPVGMHIVQVITDIGQWTRTIIIR